MVFWHGIISTGTVVSIIISIMSRIGIMIIVYIIIAVRCIIIIIIIIFALIFKFQSYVLPLKTRWEAGNSSLFTLFSCHLQSAKDICPQLQEISLNTMVTKTD